jgi:hypothetical protein
VQGKQSNRKSIKSCHHHLYSRLTKNRSQHIYVLSCTRKAFSEIEGERKNIYNENSCVVFFGYETIMKLLSEIETER